MKGEIFLKVVMDHNQFIDWKYNNKSLIDIKLENLNIQRYKQIEKKVIFILAAGLFLNIIPAEAADNIPDKMNTMGNEILRYIRLGGRWIFVICGSIEIIKSGMKKGSIKEEAPQVVIKYVLLYGCLHALTILYEYIDDFLG